jgi:hypothetical protein
MAGKLRRPGQEPPKRMSDVELEKAKPGTIEKRLSEHEKHLTHLERRPDPGAGLAPREAGPARERHLSEIDGQLNEITRLERVLEPLSREERKRLSPKSWLINRAAIANAPRSDEEKEALKEMYSGLADAERERETRRKLLDMAQKRKYPRDPRASSVLAAVISSAWLRDAVEMRNRTNVHVFVEGRMEHVPQGQFVSARLLEPGDVVVLVLASYAIEAGPGLLDALAPEGYGLSELPDVRTSLSNLHRAGLLEVEKLGERRWRARWGRRALRIAKEAGVDLPPAVTTKELEPEPRPA